MPLTRRCQLRYCTQKVITCNENSIGWADFRANSLFDPDYGVGGGQPMGFDQWTALYDQYVVTGSKITAYISYEHQEINNPPMCVGIYLADDAVIPYTNWQGLVEARKGSYRHMTAQQYRPVKVQSKFSCRKFFNIKDPVDAMDRVGAKSDADPSETAIFIIWGSTTGNTGTDAVILNVNIIMDFIVQWSEPKDLARS